MPVPLPTVEPAGMYASVASPPTATPMISGPSVLPPVHVELLYPNARASVTVMSWLKPADSVNVNSP
jgi:hypothetical protein